MVRCLNCKSFPAETTELLCRRCHKKSRNLQKVRETCREAYATAKQKAVIHQEENMRNMTKAHIDAYHIIQEDAALFNFRVGKEVIFLPFLIDIFIHDIRVGIEIDGYTHTNPEKQAGDELRDAFLQTVYKIEVVRFDNQDVYRRSFGRKIWQILSTGYEQHLRETCNGIIEKKGPEAVPAGMFPAM